MPRASNDWPRPKPKYRVLVEGLPCITYVMSINAPDKMDYVSPQVSGILGYTPSELQSDSALWQKLVHPDDRDGVARKFAEFQKAGGRFALIYRVIARNGDVVWFRNQGLFRQDAANGPIVVEGVIFDISESKRVEEALRRSQNEYRNLSTTSTTPSSS